MLKQWKKMPQADIHQSKGQPLVAESEVQGKGAADNQR